MNGVLRPAALALFALLAAAGLGACAQVVPGPDPVPTGGFEWNDLDPATFPPVASFGEDVSHTAVFGIRDEGRGTYDPMCVIVDSGVTCISDTAQWPPCADVGLASQFSLGEDGSAFVDADSCAGEWVPVDEEPYLLQEFDRVRWGDVECSYLDAELTCARADDSQYFVLQQGRIVETKPSVAGPG